MNQKEKDTIQLIKAGIKQKNPLTDIILYGSHARGQSHNDSDWDIIILLDQLNANCSLEKQYQDELFDIELEIREPISKFVFSKNDWEQKYKMTPLFQNINREGIYL